MPRKNTRFDPTSCRNRRKDSRPRLESLGSPSSIVAITPKKNGTRVLSRRLARRLRSTARRYAPLWKAGATRLRTSSCHRHTASRCRAVRRGTFMQKVLGNFSMNVPLPGLSPPLLPGQPGHCRRQLAKHRLTAHPHPAAEALSGEVIRAAGASTPGADLSGAVSAGAAGKSTSKM